VICATCADRGIVKANWSNAPDDYAICLCDVGHVYRNDGNGGKRTGFCGWQIWASQNGIDPSRIFLLEEVLTPEELADRGFQKPSKSRLADREAALLAAGKARRRL
jgi:hypothetical protein